MLKLFDFSRKGVFLYRLRHTLLHLGDVGDGLGEEVVGAVFHRRDGELYFAEGCYEDAGDRRIFFLCRFYKLHAVFARHFIVGDEKSDVGVFGEGFKRKFGVGREQAFVRGRKYLRHNLTGRFFVIDNKNLPFQHNHPFRALILRSIRGRRTVNVVPSPSWDSTAIDPP